jgi:hypothetical protein
VGAGRSGTNLLRDLLCALPGFGTWPCDEINYIWRHGNRDATTDELAADDARPEVIHYVRRAFERQQRRAGVATVVEKTCATTLRVGFAHRIVPEARFVVIVRDGRDVTASAMRRWTAGLDLAYLARKARFVPPGDLPHYALRYARNRLDRRRNSQHRLGTWGPRFAGLDEAVRTLPLAQVCALQWARCVETTDAQLADTVDPGVVHRVRYEDLVRDPTGEVGKLAAFLGVAAPVELPTVRADRVGSWREQLDEHDLAGVRAVAGDTLTRLGYP